MRRTRIGSEPLKHELLRAKCQAGAANRLRSLGTSKGFRNARSSVKLLKAEMTESTEEKLPETPTEQPIDPVLEAKADATRFKDQALRALADLDNFRKRARKEVDEAKKQGREELLREFLPVFDNVERALQSAERATDVKAVSDGLAMVLRQFSEMLSRNQLRRTPGVGTMFDPFMHEAIQQVETDEQPAGTIVAEVQAGYLQGDRLVRAAMVVVAKPKSVEVVTTDAGPDASTDPAEVADGKPGEN
jgi:molecular chaperone GrpE